MSEAARAQLFFTLTTNLPQLNNYTNFESYQTHPCTIPGAIIQDLGSLRMRYPDTDTAAQATPVILYFIADVFVFSPSYRGTLPVYASFLRVLEQAHRIYILSFLC
ncbi:uncharacterized protein ARMOST_16804 [Armillaria ostoyae]|uniref:Uncharacterized protein n=1 Tax=Armillaria ostoyae TaxID=47428 RepID=A0A284RX99_ARMOS|nr:uncharacterized protein ARMOST_16804 [Armillaria ostoyae]